MLILQQLVPPLCAQGDALECYALREVVDVFLQHTLLLHADEATEESVLALLTSAVQGLAAGVRLVACAQAERLRSAPG